MGHHGGTATYQSLLLEITIQVSKLAVDCTFTIPDIHQHAISRHGIDFALTFHFIPFTLTGHQADEVKPHAHIVAIIGSVEVHSLVQHDLSLDGWFPDSKAWPSITIFQQ